MATVTPGKVFSTNEIVTPTNLNALGVPTVTLADGEVGTAKIANGAVTQEKLNSSVTLVPTGAIMPFAMSTVPTGWLAANGNEYSKTGTYAVLFAVIGATYGETNGSGGTGTTHFRVPDLCGYFVRGSGTNRDGTAAGTFGAQQADAVISHTHSGTTGNDSPDHTHQNTGPSSNQSQQGQSGGAVPWAGGQTYTTSGANTRHTHSFTTSSQSPAGATETRPKNIALLYCIKA